MSDEIRQFVLDSLTDMSYSIGEDTVRGPADAGPSRIQPTPAR